MMMIEKSYKVYNIINTDPNNTWDSDDDISLT